MGRDIVFDALRKARLQNPYLREREEALKELKKILDEHGIKIECTIDPDAEEDCEIVYKNHRFSLWDLVSGE